MLCGIWLNLLVREPLVMTSLDKKFEVSAIRLPTLEPVGRYDLPMLCQLLSKVDSVDPFARSPGYFAMTGRKGLWLYSDDQTSMLIAQHPNDADQLLLFPPFGCDPAGLLEYAMRDPFLPHGSRKIARIGLGHEYLAMRMQVVGIGTPETEDALDWIYPVHVISPAAVLEREGSGFSNFRGHVNKAFREGMQAENIDIKKHHGDICEIVNRWASSAKKEGYSNNDLTSPTEYCLALMKEKALPLEGIITYSNGKPVGFWIWDESDRRNGMAMSMVRVAMPPRGSAEFGALKACEVLKARGFFEFCQGGSETIGLDTFKRKLNPVRSIDLQSILPALPRHT